MTNVTILGLLTEDSQDLLIKGDNDTPVKPKTHINGYLRLKTVSNRLIRIFTQV